jgi:acetoacetate decarboxylase
VVSATHIVADLTLGLGKVVHDYLDYLAPSEPSHWKGRRYELAE